jgi:radical SAM protein with 4Fe4S-binding SPASM domain
MGEPLLNPNIVDFIKKTKAKGHKVELTTNASLLNRDLAEQLVNSGLDKIIFSIDGYSKKTFESIRIGASHAQVVNNIENFIDIMSKYSKKVITEVDCIISKQTMPELEDYKDYWSKIVNDVVFLNLDDWAGQFNLPSELGESRGITHKDYRYPCHLLWTSMHISAEGNIMLCCHDYKQTSKLPNIMEKNLREIWIEDFKPFRADQVTGEISNALCLHCDEWKRMPEFYDEIESEKITNVAMSSNIDNSQQFIPIKKKMLSSYKKILNKLIDFIISSDKFLNKFISRIFESDKAFNKLALRIVESDNALNKLVPRIVYRNKQSGS